VKVNKLNI